ncbi:MAG: helix-turn-helix domain-containing protein [Parachlamydiales bacterium]|nr:helix-turn-helix domain-containing protein [Parachlamydiales bacterium]
MDQNRINVYDSLGKKGGRMDEHQIYEKLRKFRRARGISVDQLAQEIGENSQKVGRIERGQRSLTVDYLLKISKALSTPIETLLEDREEKTTASEPSSSFDSNVLNAVVLFVEEIAQQRGYTSQQKGKMISKFYEIVLQLPSENRYFFFRSLRDCLNIILQNEQVSCS